MVYVAGIIGLIGGFMCGLMLLTFLLRNVKREDLMNDPYIKWKYGLLNWGCAILGAYAGVSMYEKYFL
ncbi:MAG: hypothetical protein COB14_00630 [Alphaproteobacteria bacterium]|nr:MAG: hypothetical protein COB14_00630 [Alphaproteobacteria bacterium]